MGLNGLSGALPCDHRSPHTNNNCKKVLEDCMIPAVWGVNSGTCREVAGGGE